MRIFNIKNNKIFILKKLVFILILFAMFFSLNDVYAATITYETHGGSTISSNDIDDNENIGALPVPTKSGKIFSGWYLEDTYDTKVTSSYVVTGDTTLHAKWEDDNFPIVWKKLKECIFNGKDHNISGEDCTEYSNGKYIDTGIMLYDNTNHGLDYEIGFKIEHYDPDEQDANIPQQTFMNTKLEGTNYPGLVFRRNGDKVELASRRTSSANSSHQEEYENWTDVRIYRVDKVIYYSVNEVEMHSLNGLYNFNPEFELNVWFGAAPKNADATVAQRFLNGTLSNMYIKVGNYEEKDNYKVYKPDGTVDEVEKYSDYLLENVNNTKPDKKLATVTFDYNDGEPNTVDFVKKQYIGNGWTVFDTDYENEDSFRVINDVALYPKYVESIVGVTLPEPTRENYTFDGWYNEDGELVTSYNETEDIVLHAEWTADLPADFNVDENDITLIVGESHQIEVTFIPNGTMDTITYTGYDNTKISIVDGLITGLSKGETTITVGTENTDITKTITVNVLSNELETTEYEIKNISSDRIVIGSEPGVLVSEYKENMTNPLGYIKVYDAGAEVGDIVVKTGLIMKLEINGTTYDEAAIIVRGDINGDGLVNVMDKSMLSEHILRTEEIEGYGFYAADVYNDDLLNVQDKSKLSDYILRVIDSLN